MVEQILRGDPALSEQARDQLSSVISQMYAALTVTAQPIRIHMRSDRAFIPAAGELLSDLLEQMQESLLTEGVDDK